MSENKNFFRASAEDFKKIPGSPVAYWLSTRAVDSFLNQQLATYGNTRQGFATGDNNRFLRLWHEVSHSMVAFNCSSGQESRNRDEKWFPCHKGGSFRKWYGNHEYLVNWFHNGEEMSAFVGSVIRNPQYYFQKGLNWSSLSSGTFGMRMGPEGFLFESKGSMFFANSMQDLDCLLGMMNSKSVNYALKVLAPTLDFHEGPVSKTPIVSLPSERRRIVESNVDSLVRTARVDWNSYETSWDFTVNPLVAARGGALRSSADSAPFASAPAGDENESGQRSVASGQNESGQDGEMHTAHCPLSTLYAALRRKWAKNCEEMRRLETENNRIFIEAYGLQDELTPEVPWHEITLTCNPWYRYSAECGVQSAELPRDGKLEERLKGDTVKELISYAVGCMMGRYSLEKPGLILADQGATISDYWEKVRSAECGAASGEGVKLTPHSALNTPHSFTPDDDGIIPILDNDWFADDIVTGFKEFIKVAFGEAHFFENMEWIVEALGKNLRDYFTKDFYKDHLQRYQNRPIYWLFQSPKGAFRALVYMHRYKPDMVGGVLGYLRSLQTKVENQLGVATQIASDESKSSTERVRANKEVVKYSKMQKELDEYEKHVLYPLSTERIEIDLDDGVKVNYAKFALALAKVKVLESKGE